MASVDTDVLAETLDVFDGVETPGTPLTTTEVAESLDCSRRTAYNRLERLTERGDIETKKVGARGRVWWRRRGADSAFGLDPGQLEQVFDAVGGYAIFTLDPEGAIHHWPEGARRLTGYDADEVRGEHVSTLYTEADTAASVPDRHLERATSNAPAEHESLLVCADGSRVPVRDVTTTIRDGDGSLEGYTKVLRDARPSEDAAEVLSEYSLFEELLETSPVGIAVLAPDGRITRVNRQLEAVLGLPDGGMAQYDLGQLELRRPSGEPLPYEERPVPRTLETGKPVDRQVVRFDDDDPTWVSVNTAPVTGEDGTLRRVVVTVTDVTHLHERTHRLQRQRDELRTELETVYERIDDAVFGLDDEWRFTYLNERAETLLERDADALVGRRVWEEFPEAIDSAFQEHYETAMREQRSVSFEAAYEPLDTWFEVTAYPSQTGLSVYFRDVSERVEYKRRLELSEHRYRLLAEHFPEGFVALVDPDLEYVLVEGAVLEDLGLDAEAFENESVGSVSPFPAVSDIVTEQCRAAVDGERGQFEVEVDGLTFEAWTVPITDDDDIVGAMLVAQDVTEQKEREQELERYETIVDSLWDGVYALDPEERFVMVNDELLELTGYDREELLGAPSTVLTGEDVSETAAEYVSAHEDGEDGGVTLELGLRTRDGDTVPVESRFGPYRYDEDRYARTGVVRDIRDREHFAETLTSLHEYSRKLLGAESKADVSELIVGAAADVLDLPGSVVNRYDEERDEFYREARRFEEGFTDGGLETAPNDGSSITSNVFQRGETRHVRDVRTTPDRNPSIGEHNMRGGLFVPMGDHGVFFTASRSVGNFDDQTVNLVELLTANAVAAYDRVEREERLRTQREQLDALNNLNEVVRDINGALVRQSTREEVEKVVCERLAELDAYRFAWFADVDPRTETINPRVEAGVSGYLDEISLSASPGDATSRGPAGTAIRTREMAVTRDAFTDPDFEPWREYAKRYSYRASAAIPVVHEDTLYGVIGLYTDREDAFSRGERDVIGQLGELVGHIIAAVERKQALMSDEVIEVEFRMRNVFDNLGIPLSTTEPIAIDRTVPLGDGSYLQFGSVHPDDVANLERILDGLDYWEELTLLDDEFGSVSFELRVSEPPAVSTIASNGGDVKQVVIDDSDFGMTIHLSPSTDVRQVIDTVTDLYPNTEMLTRRQLARTDADKGRINRTLTEELTDRQRTVLEAAYYAGFFDWPRQSSGEDLADSLAVSPPTFHQHLRHAQRKLLDAIYDE